MKLIAGSILASFGLLVTASGNLLPFYYSTIKSQFNPAWEVPHGSNPLVPRFILPTPIEVLAILFIAGGIGLIGWSIWENVKKRE
jgi:hypothetical protein